MTRTSAPGTTDGPVVLMPIMRDHTELIASMARPGSPLWARNVAALVLEGERVLLVRDGRPLRAPCRKCGPASKTRLWALHRKGKGPVYCLLTCESCGERTEAAPATSLAASLQLSPAGIEAAFEIE